MYVQYIRRRVRESALWAVFDPSSDELCGSSYVRCNGVSPFIPVADDSPGPLWPVSKWCFRCVVSSSSLYLLI